MEFTEEQLAVLDRERAKRKKRTGGHQSAPKNEEANEFQSVNHDWQEQLQKTQNGRNYSNAFNTLLILNNDEKLKGKFAFNLLTQRAEILGSVPWKRIDSNKEINNHDDSCLRNYLSINYDIKSKDIVFDALNQIVMDHAYHPIQEYLKNLNWDGRQRLDSLLIDFFDADDNELTRWQTRLALVGAVKRVFHPGCKMDYVLTLKGDQGVGKSTFFQKLAIKDEWFSDSLDDMRGKDGKEQLIGNWIIELGEMAAVSKGDQKRIKQFITSTEDEFRPAYGRRTVRFKRQNIFVATTNDELPLKDDTGGRRWWIIEVKTPWFEKGLLLDIDQVWAEAMHQYEYMQVHDIPLRLPNYLEQQAKKVQIQNTDRGLFASKIEDALEKGYIEKNDYQQGKIKTHFKETCAFHVWEEILGRHKNDLNKATAREINAVLKNIEGWECLGRRLFEPYGKQTVYKRKDI